MAYEYEFHFGFKLEGTIPQIKFYDSSATTWYEYTIPAGTYFLKHEDHTKDIVHVICNMCADFADFAIPNGTRQITLKQKNSGDYFQIIDTRNTNRDSEKLIHLLGLQDNDGDCTTVYNRNMIETEISNVPVHSWYSSGGVMQDSLTPTGFQDYNTYITRNAKGRTSQLSSGAINRTKVVLTSIPSNCVRVDDIYPQQTTLYTTDLAETWTASFWTAYDPTITDNCFYWEYTDLEGNVTYGTYYILEPIAPNNCKPTMATSDKFWDIEIKTSCIPYVPQDKYIYFPYNTLNYAQSLAGVADWAITGDMSMLIKFYIVNHQNFAYVFIMWQSSGGYNVNSIRVYNNRLQFVQGTTALSYNFFDLLGYNFSYHRWYTFFITREGASGTNNVQCYLDGEWMSQHSVTRPGTGVTAPYLAFMDASVVAVNTIWGALGGFYMWDRVLTAEERALVFIGRPDEITDNLKIALPMTQQGGQYLMNTANSGVVFDSIHPKLYGSYDWRSEDEF